MEIEEAQKWADLCSICGKPVRYWHDYLEGGDDIIAAKWHKRCAKDYQTWLHKVTHILPSYQEAPTLPRPIRIDTFLDNYYKRILSKTDNV